MLCTGHRHGLSAWTPPPRKCPEMERDSLPAQSFEAWAEALRGCGPAGEGGATASGGGGGGGTADEAIVQRAVCPTPHCRGIVWASAVRSARSLPCRRCGRAYPSEAFPEAMAPDVVAPGLAQVWGRVCAAAGDGGAGAAAHELLDAAAAAAESSPAFAAHRRFCVQLAAQAGVPPETWGVRYARPGEAAGYYYYYYCFYYYYYYYCYYCCFYDYYYHYYYYCSTTVTTTTTTILLLLFLLLFLLLLLPLLLLFFCDYTTTTTTTIT